MTYRILDTETGRVVGHVASLESAYAKADARNANAGSLRFAVKPVPAN